MNTTEIRTFKSRLNDYLPAWVVSNLYNKHSWKLLARCWVASWASFVIILPTKSLTAFGNTAFFVMLVSLIIPPGMPVQMFFFAVSIMLIGMLFGWAIGAATMKAAVSARNQVLLRSTYEAARQTAATSTNPDIAFKLEIFEGVFLDTRATVVFGVMFGVFSFLFALIRAYRPRLVLASTFAQIFFDIFCSYGPLFPNTQYTILNSIIISVSTYLAIGLVCCIFVFPETMSHSYLSLVSILLGDLKSYTEAIGSILDLLPSEIADNKDGLVSQCASKRVGLYSKIGELEQKNGLINLEFSWGRWNGNDAKNLGESLRILVSRISSFYSFPKLLSIYTSEGISRTTTRSTELGEEDAIAEKEEFAGDTELIRQLNSKSLSFEREYNVRLEDVLPLLRDSTVELRMAVIDALGAAQELIAHINGGRWTRNSEVFAEKEREFNDALEGLRARLDSFKSKGRMAILEPFLPLFSSVDQNKFDRKRLPLRSLIVCSAFSAQLVVSSEGLLELLDVIHRTVQKRRKPRLWAPSGLRAIWNFIFKKGKSESVELALGEDVMAEIDEEIKHEEAPYSRDPDSRPPSNIFQRVMDTIHSIYVWFKTAEAKFATKYAVMSILLWIPAVVRNSAHFYYIEKGIWALIMAQTSMNVYVSDTISSLLGRCVGTFLGLIAGLLVWYIGSGNGNGNPYGLAATFGVVLIPVLFIRNNMPLAYLVPAIMFNATFALIVGYSWLDGHLTTLGNPGIGWPIAWKRFVLVMIGVAAAVIMMMIPPVSGRKAVRMRNAAVISELSNLYSTLMSVWINGDNAEGKSSANEQTNDGRTEHNGSDIEAVEAPTQKDTAPSFAASSRANTWARPFRLRLISLVEQLQGLQVQTALAKFEGNIRGSWPSEEYMKLLQHESDMLAALAQLTVALQRLDPSWRTSLNRRTMVLNPNFITDVMSTFALVSQSLRTAEPMHQILPTSLLDRLLYHHTHDILTIKEMNRKEITNYVERVSSEQFIYFATGVAAVSQVIRSLDEMHRLTRRLCGEIPFRGFHEWKSDYDRPY